MTSGGAAIPVRAATSRKRRTIALVGNPNSGKTTVFNALTGLHQKVGNYPGVTVERKQGLVSLPGGAPCVLLDLPGLYSLTPHSPDEVIARDVLLGYRTDTPRPEAIVNVVDASNLERNLYLTSQLADLGLPMLVVLTMSDTATRHGLHVDAEALEESLGIPVKVVIASRSVGLDFLRAALAELPDQTPPPPRGWRLPALAEEEIEELSGLLREHHQLAPPIAFAEAVALLSLSEGRRHDLDRWAQPVREHVERDFARLDEAELDVSTAVAEARYAEVESVARLALRQTSSVPITFSDKLDRIFLHRFWGYVVFAAVMYIVFQAMFSWAAYPTEWIEAGVDWVGGVVASALPDGDLRDMLINGALAGVGNTIVFLPQILLLFLLVSLLEDTGYLARAAFLMDRLMSRVGLHGKSFVPLLSANACAIPGIMATRTIDSPQARLLTILVAPLMSCSARLPVYALMIGAFIPATVVMGVLNLQAVTLFSMYALGTLAAFSMAALFNRTMFRSAPPSFLLEMPPYRAPAVRTVLMQMMERSLLFLKRAGTVIMAISVVLWFLATYPKQPAGASASDQVRQSFAGQMGRAVEPIIKPLGFDWKMGIGLIASFAAREVFVTAMGTIYNVDEDAAADEEKLSLSLGEKMRSDTDPVTGRNTYTPLTAIALLVYYVLAMQCMSTVAVVRRETNSWKWPLFQIGYMSVLAWTVTFIVYQGGRLLGFG